MVYLKPTQNIIVYYKKVHIHICVLALVFPLQLSFSTLASIGGTLPSMQQQQHLTQQLQPLLLKQQQRRRQQQPLPQQARKQQQRGKHALQLRRRWRGAVRGVSMISSRLPHHQA
jgi:hypothetical protein